MLARRVTAKAASFVKMGCKDCWTLAPTSECFSEGEEDALCRTSDSAAGLGAVILLRAEGFLCNPGLHTKSLEPAPLTKTAVFLCFCQVCSQHGLPAPLLCLLGEGVAGKRGTEEAGTCRSSKLQP